MIVNLPPPVDDDSLVKKNKHGLLRRAKRRALDQRSILAAEEPCLVIYRPTLANVDNNNLTFKDFITDYVEKWRPLEIQHGSAWRVDKPVDWRTSDGEIEKTHQKTGQCGGVGESLCTCILSISMH